MISLKNISKTYEVGENKIHALKSVSLDFKANEFVSIVGESGCGKTTLLNIIGALHSYDTGTIIINGEDTKSYTQRDWDTYRNTHVGFVFQGYNLIQHLTVFENVALSLKIGDAEKTKIKEMVENALAKVGMGKEAYKKPSQLSGGQMQRVAIARAIVNNPTIILADEPTGALDSENSKQVSDILKELSKNSLVVLVTHNRNIANEYSDRIIEMKDGEIINEVVKNETEREEKENKLKSIKNKKKSNLNYFSTFKLSFKNLISKKYRSLLTAFACSIGIIGIALILAVSNGLSIFLKNTEQAALTAMPVTVRSFHVDVTKLSKLFFTPSNKEVFPDTDKIKVVRQKPLEQLEAFKNINNRITPEYVEYINKMPKGLAREVVSFYGIDMKILVKEHDKFKELYGTAGSIEAYKKNIKKNTLQSKVDLDSWTPSWQEISSDEEMIVGKNGQYKIIAGRYAKEKNEVVLIVNPYNEINEYLITNLGFDLKSEFAAKDFLGKKLYYLENDNFYKEDGDYFVPKTMDEISKTDITEELEIVGVIRLKDMNSFALYYSGLGHTKKLTDIALKNGKESKVYKAQKNRKTEYVVRETTTPKVFTPDTNEYDLALRRLGGSETPVYIDFYPENLKSRDKLLEYLNSYNYNKPEEKQVKHMDLTKFFTKSVENILDKITIALVIFSSVSLIVSSLLIALVTYISVIERRKEIGILRALGASKKNIAGLFRAENLVLGFLSGIMGIFVAYLLSLLGNVIVKKLYKNIVFDLFNISYLHALGLILLSVILSVLSGLIPAIIASSKQPVDALRSEV